MLQLTPKPGAVSSALLKVLIRDTLDLEAFRRILKPSSKTL